MPQESACSKQKLQNKTNRVSRFAMDGDSGKRNKLRAPIRAQEVERVRIVPGDDRIAVKYCMRGYCKSTNRQRMETSHTQPCRLMRQRRLRRSLLGMRGQRRRRSVALSDGPLATTPVTPPRPKHGPASAVRRSRQLQEVRLWIRTLCSQAPLQVRYFLAHLFFVFNLSGLSSRLCLRPHLFFSKLRSPLACAPLIIIKNS